MKSLTDALIRELPKTDLHLHLDGSLRPETLLELAEEHGVKLPAKSVKGLYKKVFKETYTDLMDYLQGFAYTCAVMRTPAAIERIAYELCEDNFEEGVRYFEMRFAPQLLTGDGMDIATVLKACSKGIQRAERKWNKAAAIANGNDPPFRAAIIVCAMRFFAAPFSATYARMFEAFGELPDRELFGLASEALVNAAIDARDKFGLPVVGVDLAGAERGFPAKDHQAAYQLAHDAFLGKTVHAGEDYGPESIFQAITDCHADRIGHGTWIFSTKRLPQIPPAQRKQYVNRLVQYVADRRLTLEVCLTSNMQTLPELGALKNHPFKRMLKERLSTTLCTDNRLVSRTTVSKEYRLAIDTFHLKPKDLSDQLVYGFKRSFFPGEYREKRVYVRQVLDYRDRVFEKHGVSIS
ncbi:MAG: adenosine deaminase [Planctomycetota bacterium]|nr:MAG: adenosine deaminase [Planctomycetota bacterium]